MGPFFYPVFMWLVMSPQGEILQYRAGYPFQFGTAKIWRESVGMRGERVFQSGPSNTFLDDSNVST